MNSNGAKKILHTIRIPGAILACLVILATLGGWYMSYANDSAVTAETLKTHGEDIVELKETDKEIKTDIKEQTKILLEIHTMYKLAKPKLAEEAKKQVEEMLNSADNDTSTNVYSGDGSDGN